MIERIIMVMIMIPATIVMAPFIGISMIIDSLRRPQAKIVFPSQKSYTASAGGKGRVYHYKGHKELITS